MQEIQAQSLGQEDPLEKRMTTHTSILAWKIPWSLAGYSPWGHKKSDTTEQVTHTHTSCIEVSLGGTTFNHSTRRTSESIK